MSGTRFFSQDWTEVEILCPQLRPHVSVSRHHYRSRASYVLHDPLTGANLRLGPGAWKFVGLLDGRTPVDQIWLQLVEEFGEGAPTQDQIIDVLAALHRSDLLLSDRLPDLEEVEERRSKRARMTLKRNLLAPTSIRIPLTYPDPWLRKLEPAVRPLLSLTGLFCWCVLVIAGLVTAGKNWDSIVENVPDRVLSAENLVGYIFVFIGIKAVHELGHGLMACRFGATVRDVGLMILVFMPVPYVEASAANALPNRWHRAAVAAAGILVEVGIAAIAVLVWAHLEPGVARALMHDTMLVAGVSTLLVNANPLLKFDGYFFLCDVLEMPNLAKNANTYWRRLTESLAFGLEQTKDQVARGFERFVWFIYAPAAFVYRIVLSVTIATFIAQEYFIIGVLLGIWSICLSLIYPFGKALIKVLSGPSLRPVRTRAVGVTFGAISLVFLIVTLIPLPLRSTAQGVLWLPEAAQLRAGSDGWVESQTTPSGTFVDVGQPLMSFTNALLITQLSSLRAQHLEFKRREAAYRGLDATLTAQVRADLEDIELRVALLEKKVDRLKVQAPIAGEFDTQLAPQDLQGRFFREGELLGWIVPETLSDVHVVLDQRSFARSERGIKDVRLRPLHQPERILESATVRLSPGGVQKLPSASLGTQFGGQIAVNPNDPDGTLPLERVFTLVVTLREDQVLPGALANLRLRARISHSPEPLAGRLWRKLRDYFKTEFRV